jgi:hypoxanthine-guanine phosphoribosyltransferase
MFRREIEMIDEKKVKKIVSTFLRKKSGDIDDETVIDTTVLQGSVLFARMLSKVNDVCSTDIDGQDIKTYGDLISAINSGS